MIKLLKKLASIAAAIVAAFGVVAPVVASASAQESATSSVMEDLKLDATFNAEEYPEKTIEELKESGEEYLQVIRIAESVNDELYVYVYQPSDSTKEIEASMILLGQTTNESAARVYDLTLTSTDGVFDKYRVDGLEVLPLEVRNYTITSIYRPFDATLDKETGNDNKDDYMAVPVAQTWYARNTADGGREYAHTTDEVVTVTAEWHGEILYSDAFHFPLLGVDVAPHTMSHFIAFTTDRKIDQLLKAEITFVQEQYNYAVELQTGNKYLLKQQEYPRETRTIEAGQTGGNNPNWTGHKYEWNRINTINDFLSSEGDALSSGAIAELNRITEESQGKGAFVLRFFEVPYKTSTFTNATAFGYLTQTVYETVRIKQVALMKLTFRTDGREYVMGVVDSMSTSDGVPDGVHDAWEGLWLNLKAAFENLQKSLRKITVAIGAIMALALVGLATYGIVTLINWIRDGVHRRRGGKGDKL